MQESSYVTGELSAADISAGRHRDAVGGLWNEIGKLQFEFLRARGLNPSHRLVDIGCGSLRGGVHFIPYLNRGHYFGIDRNKSLLDGGGGHELRAAGLMHFEPQLLVSLKFPLLALGIVC